MKIFAWKTPPRCFFLGPSTSKYISLQRQGKALAEPPPATPAESAPPPGAAGQHGARPARAGQRRRLGGPRRGAGPTAWGGWLAALRNRPSVERGCGRVQVGRESALGTETPGSENRHAWRCFPGPGTVTKAPDCSSSSPTTAATFTSHCELLRFGTGADSARIMTLVSRPVA